MGSSSKPHVYIYMWAGKWCLITCMAACMRQCNACRLALSEYLHGVCSMPDEVVMHCMQIGTIIFFHGVCSGWSFMAFQNLGTLEPSPPKREDAKACGKEWKRQEKSLWGSKKSNGMSLDCIFLKLSVMGTLKPAVATRVWLPAWRRRSRWVLPGYLPWPPILASFSTSWWERPSFKAASATACTIGADNNPHARCSIKREARWLGGVWELAAALALASLCLCPPLSMREATQFPLGEENWRELSEQSLRAKMLPMMFQCITTSSGISCTLEAWPTSWWSRQSHSNCPSWRWCQLHTWC